MLRCVISITRKKKHQKWAEILGQVHCGEGLRRKTACLGMGDNVLPILFSTEPRLAMRWQKPSSIFTCVCWSRKNHPGSFLRKVGYSILKHIHYLSSSGPSEKWQSGTSDDIKGIYKRLTGRTGTILFSFGGRVIYTQ